MKIHLFQLSCAVISIEIDSISKFAISLTANITERDFKSEYLFRIRSVATNLVTSLEFRPIRCATRLCHFERTRNGYVATHFILLSSCYVVVPERSGQNEGPPSRN